MGEGAPFKELCRGRLLIQGLCSPLPFLYPTPTKEEVGGFGGERSSGSIPPEPEAGWSYSSLHPCVPSSFHLAERARRIFQSWTQAGGDGRESAEVAESGRGRNQLRLPRADQ